MTSDKKTLAVKPRVFISYSRKDGETFANELRAKLQAKHIPLWQDRVGMEGGKDWWLQIVEALDKVEFMVLVMTPKAIQSDIIRKEWRYARQKGVCVYPVKGLPDQKLDYAALPHWMQGAHFYDLDYEWDKFINDLNTRCREPRVPFMVEDLPKNIVERPEEFNALIDQLLDLEREESLAITTAIKGTGGYGKTTLAIALCHNEHVQDAYDDGILWVTLGEEPGDITEKIKNLIEILTGDRPGFTEKAPAATHLSELLADRDILMVIDDAWDSSHIQPFLRGGPRCSRLITTRNSETLPIGSKQNILDAMQADEAENLLAYGLPVSQKEELQTLSKRLGRWPLILKLANTFLVERIVNRGQALPEAIAYLFKRLDKYGITAFDARKNKDCNQAVEATLSVSLELLNEDEKQRFAELAVFPGDIDIPLQTVEKLWSHVGFDELDTEDLCERLFRLSLLQRFDPNTRAIRLHDVIRGYLRTKNRQQLSQMQTMFLKAYDVDQWADMSPEEPYLWKHMAYHLADGGQVEKLHDLLCNYQWIRRKIDLGGVNALLADYDYLTKDKEISLIQISIRLSANQIVQDRNQLTPHLLCRLKDQTSTGIQRLLQSAVDDAQKATWFHPVYCSLTLPGGPLLRTLESHSQRRMVTALAISPDGKIAFTGSISHAVTHWDLTAGKEIQTIMGHSGWISGVAISPDGKTAVSGSRDGALKHWDLNTDKEIRTLIGRGSVEAVAISPDGKIVLYGSNSGPIHRWDLATAKEMPTLYGHSLPVEAVAISPDGRTAVSGSHDSTLKHWDLASGKEIRTLIGHSNPVVAVAISPDGKTTASGSEDTTLKHWDLASGKEIRTLVGHSHVVTAVTFSPDGKTIISGSLDSTLKQWDLTTCSRTPNLIGHSGWISGVAISPDGKTAVIGSLDGTIKHWDLATCTEILTLKGYSSVTAVAFSPDGKTIISGLSNKTLKLWDLSTGKEIRTIKGLSFHVEAVAISPDGKTIISGLSNKTLKLWDLATGKEVRTLQTTEGSGKAVAINPDGKSAVFGSFDTLKLWDFGTGKVFTTLKGRRDFIEVVAISPDGKTAVSGSRDGALMRWDLNTGKLLTTIKGHSNSVLAVAISQDGETAVSGSYDNTLKLWDLSKGERITLFIAESPITSVAFASSERLILAGDLVGHVHFFRIEGGE